MSPTRIVLGVAAIALLVLATVLGLRDLRVDDANCGSALIRRDPLATLVLTGDHTEDAFIEHRITSSCDRAVVRQRFLIAGPVVAALGCIIGGRALRSAEES